jgi:hypothetical protein
MDLTKDLAPVAGIAAVPMILDVVKKATGMGFIAVARVTEGRWITCASKDDLAFGLKPGDELKVETTICHEIRQSREAVIIDDVATDAVYCGHHTPAMYGWLYFDANHARRRIVFRVRSMIRRRSGCSSSSRN